MKSIIIFIICIFSNLSFADSTTVCTSENRCINKETNAFLGLTFTPSYKNQYPIELLDETDSCENKIKPSVDLPKNSYFRQTLDKEAQTADEILVHVYELDKQTSENEDKNDKEYTTEKFFSSPFKVCLSGDHKISKSYYKRVGGVSTGVLVVPFKLREGDIYSDSTIGPYVSYKWEIIEILATAGMSQISVSEIGTEEVESKTGLTYAFGVNFEVAKNWDIAFIAGADHLSGDSGDTWKYQDEMWLSFGIGYNFTR